MDDDNPNEKPEWDDNEGDHLPDSADWQSAAHAVAAVPVGFGLEFDSAAGWDAVCPPEYRASWSSFSKCFAIGFCWLFCFVFLFSSVWGSEVCFAFILVDVVVVVVEQHEFRWGDGC